MELDKATKKLQDLEVWLRDADWGDDADALKLGIEALKREQERREDIDFGFALLLPGETEE